MGKKVADVRTKKHHRCDRISAFRVCTTLLLIAVGVVGSIQLYSTLREEEIKTADSEFASYKRLLELAVESNLQDKKRASQAMSRVYQNACPTDDHWPSCYLGQEYLTDVSLQIFNGIIMVHGVIITPEERREFEDDFYERYKDVDIGTSSFGEGVYGLSGTIGGPDFRYPIVNGSFGVRRLAPIIQIPFVETFGNQVLLYDEYSEIIRFHTINEMISLTEDRDTPVSVLSDIITFPADLTDPAAALVPKCLLFTSVAPKNSSSTVARGYALVSVIWGDVLSDIVPAQVSGIFAVVNINGVDYEFSIEDSVAMFKDKKTASAKGNHLDIFDGSSEFYLSIGRTSEFDENYESNNPIIAVVIFVAMIVAISAAFFAYDQFVNKQILRKEIILSTKQLFVRYISHEIRTPINTVCIGIGLVFEEMRSALQEGGFTDPQMEMLRHWLDVVFSVSESSTAAVQVLNDLLDYEQIEISKLNMDVSVFSLYTVLDTVYRSCQYQLAAKSITATLTTDLNGNGMEMTPNTDMGSTEEVDGRQDRSKLVVVGDSKKIEQAVRNFMSNAIKFTPPGGRIEVSCSWVSDRREASVKMKGSKSKTVSHCGDGLLQVRVKDTGAGLTESQLRKLFQEGVQFDANRLQDGKGSGLGLWISKGIVEEHRGSIYAESDGSGRGSTFVFELPVTYDKDFQLVKTEPVTEITKQGAAKLLRPDSMRNVLLCDDSVSSVKLVKRLLTKAGYTVEVSYDGSECLEKLETDDYHKLCDMVIIDNHMPHMTGPEAVRKMREKGYQLCIVGLTGSVTKDELDEFMSAGCDYVLGKPLQLSKLDEIIQEVGGGSSEVREVSPAGH